ncbi:Mor transcription activator family protein [Halomonas lysinitropha]|uniref:Mor transcription activator family protein n=1 Tax=Halomonas lysinitropha TaxID=2607506 RepID=A0A5K1I944_9GAMM|nr:Mor transcription activator family protein [Halomonas lysinitropha]VVZ96743.1 Mor transcription activator family protein [Halomonas lysinitropha]
MPRRSAILDELADFIGYDAAMTLAKGWGGRRLYIRAQANPCHPITLEIGPEAAEKLAYFYGGTSLDVPGTRNATLEARNRQIMVALEEGQPTREVAVTFGLTARHVRHIRSHHEAERQAHA